MAITFVGSATGSTGTSGDASFTITLPATQENDIVIVAVGWSSPSDDAPGVSTSGYTEIAEIYADDNADANLSVSWKLMGATPDTEVICLTRNSVNVDSVGIAYVFRGVDTASPIDVSATTATGTNSAVPDPASITPTTAGAFVVACGLGTASYAAGDSSVTPPAGYTNGVSIPSVYCSYGCTLAVASKAWSGSGAEDPAAWTGWTTSSLDSWGAVTVALRPIVLIEPPSGSLTITGSAPAIGVAPASVSLALTGKTPTVGTAVPVAPLTGSLTFTGQIPVPLVAVPVYPATDQIAYTGFTPQLLYNRLNVTLPAISAYFEATGASASLQVTLPGILFEADMGQPSWLQVELPPFALEFFSGSSLGIDLPVPELALTAVTGATCALDVILPSLSFLAKTGSKLSIDIPVMDALFTGTSGTAGGLVVALPPISALFEAQVETLGQLEITLPAIQTLFTLQQDILSSLVVGLPPVSCLFEASVGNVATLSVGLPALEVLFTQYENITGSMIVELPAIKAFLEMSHSGRFDTSTAAEIANVILKWRRP